MVGVRGLSLTPEVEGASMDEREIEQVLEGCGWGAGNDKL